MSPAQFVLYALGFNVELASIHLVLFCVQQRAEEPYLCLHFSPCGFCSLWWIIDVLYFFDTCLNAFFTTLVTVCTYRAPFLLGLECIGFCSVSSLFNLIFTYSSIICIYLYRKQRKWLNSNFTCSKLYGVVVSLAASPQMCFLPTQSKVKINKFQYYNISASDWTQPVVHPPAYPLPSSLLPGLHSNSFYPPLKFWNDSTKSLISYITFSAFSAHARLRLSTGWECFKVGDKKCLFAKAKLDVYHSLNFLLYLVHCVIVTRLEARICTSKAPTIYCCLLKS